MSWCHPFQRCPHADTHYYRLCIGEGILKPAYLKACCYGRDSLEGNEHGGHCDNPSVHSPKGFFVCDENGHSQTHKDLVLASNILLGISIAIQIVNIMSIDYDLVGRLQEIEKDAKGQLSTVNVAKIMAMLGTPLHIMKMAFPGKIDNLVTRPGSLPLDYHAHWAHPGIYRLLCLDPIFGLLLSAQDFLGFRQATGVVRILCNICKTPMPPIAQFAC